MRVILGCAVLVRAVVVRVALSVALCPGRIDDVDNLLGVLRGEDALPIFGIFVETGLF